MILDPKQPSPVGKSTEDLQDVRLEFTPTEAQRMAYGEFLVNIWAEAIVRRIREADDAK